MAIAVLEKATEKQDKVFLPQMLKGLSLQVQRKEMLCLKAFIYTPFTFARIP
jgi:hypothetical protein